MKDSVIAELKVVPLGPKLPALVNMSLLSSMLSVRPKVLLSNYAHGTVVQGPLAQVLALAQEMHEVPFKMGANRVSTTISIDDRRDKLITMESKVKAVSK